jgi:hypothetical protein
MTKLDYVVLIFYPASGGAILGPEAIASVVLRGSHNY